MPGEYRLSAWALWGFAALAWNVQPLRAAETTLDELAGHTHIHGLAVDRSDPSALFVATHHGLFRATADGTAVLVSEVQDFMGFNPHPTEPNKLYASGHPASGGNLGFIQSTDAGRTWQQISPGANGPVDFHQMAVSSADPETIYGVYGDLQLSRDGGNTWQVVGPAPEGLIDLAASPRTADELYAATEAGLLASTDAGKSWNSLLEGVPVTTVEATAEGALLAFVVGRGLLRSNENPPALAPMADPAPGGYILHLTVDPANPDRMFAATGEGQIVTSMDAGKSWGPFGSSH